MNINNLFGELHNILAAIVSLGTISVTGFKFINNIYCVFKKDIEERAELSNKINVIFNEVTPNHGSSLKDKVDKIEKCIISNQKVIEMIGDRQKWILDKQQIPIFESDGEGMCIWANDAYLELLKRDSTEVMGNGWRNFIHQDDREKVVNEWENAIKENRSSQSMYRMVDKDGKVYNVECYATKHPNNGYSGNIKIK
jgi:PAS domain S-box-containing protein